MILHGAADVPNYGATNFLDDSQIRTILMVMVLLVLTGCASVSGPQDSSPTPGEAPVTSGEPEQQTGAGALAMLQKAENFVQHRRVDLAIPALERALRLEPRNPLIWHRLAAAHLLQGNRQQAVRLATKSNSLIGADHPLRAQNDSIITRARQ